MFPLGLDHFVTREKMRIEPSVPQTVQDRAGAGSRLRAEGFKQVSTGRGRGGQGAVAVLVFL